MYSLAGLWLDEKNVHGLWLAGRLQRARIWFSFLQQSVCAVVVKTPEQAKDNVDNVIVNISKFFCSEK